MPKATRDIRAFTLIELLTVIAIIAILTAILFPIAGTVREQARANDCLTHLHQLWVSANVYKEDEGGYPPSLYGPAEGQVNGTTTHVPWDPTAGNETLLPADGTILGYLYRENMKDFNLFRCPDSDRKDKFEIVRAYYPDVQSADPTKPYYWPPTDSYGNPIRWIAYNDDARKQPPAAGPWLCRHDATVGGTEDCFWEVAPSDPLYLKPRFFYAVNAYDIGPAIDPVSGKQLLDSNNQKAYFRHYATDWTGVTGSTDLPFQLKYANPPDDKTMLTYCSWHALIAHSGSAPCISMGGTAKKLDLKQVLSYTSLVYTH